MVESARKRRPDFLTRILESEMEDALGDRLLLEVDVLDIALGDNPLRISFRSM